MSIKYDPFTGEPITDDESVTEIAVDAIENNDTGNNIFQSNAQEGYDAQSDPLAGNYTFQSSAVEENATSDVLDDEMSGATSYGTPDTHYSAPYAQAQSDTMSVRTPVMTEEPLRMEEPVVIPVKPGKKVNAGLIVGIISALLVVAAVVVVVLFGGFFDSPKKKVAKAIKNTFSGESHLSKDLEKLDILKGDKYAVTIAANVINEAKFDITVASDGKEKQIYGAFDVDSISSDISEGEFALGIDDEYVRFALDLDGKFDETFIYSYVEEKTGLLGENVPKETLDELDNAFKMIYESTKNNNSTEEYQKALTEIVNKHVDDLKFEKADKEEFEVDGKDVKCSGYTVVIDGEWVSDFMGDVFDAYDEHIGLENLLSYTGEEIDIDEIKDEMTEEFSDMPEVAIDFYIYKNKLAAICITPEDDSTLKILFRGGDRRAQNIAIAMDDNELISIVGEDDKKKKKESYTIEVDGEEVMVITYDYDDKELAFEIDGEELVIRIESDKDSISFVLVEAPEIGDMLDLSLTITEDVKLKKMSGKDVIDLTDITESEIIEFVMKYPDLFGRFANGMPSFGGDDDYDYDFDYDYDYDYDFDDYDFDDYDFDNYDFDDYDF